MSSITKHERYHGAALAKVVKFPTFKKLNRHPLGGFGHYLINETISLFVKYTTSGADHWQFTFSGPELRRIYKASNDEHTEHVWVAFVCAKDGICLLEKAELGKVLKIRGARKARWLTIERKPNQGYRVKGSQGSLGRAITRSRFPKFIFNS